MRMLFVLLALLQRSARSFIVFTSLYPTRTTTSIVGASILSTDPATLLQDVGNGLAPLLNFDGDSENLLGLAKAGLPVVLLAAFVATRAPLQLVNKSTLGSIVEGTYLAQGGDLERVYKASKDGWSAIDFHRAVDGKGSAVVVARGIAGQTFGGFNPNGWRSTDDYYSSTAAFLWCLQGNRVVKLPIMAGGNCAVFDYATSGPCFGSADLMIGPPRAAVMGGFAGPDAEDISKSAGSLRSCKSAVGTTYENERAWPVRGGMKLVEVEVYCNANV